MWFPESGQGYYIFPAFCITHILWSLIIPLCRKCSLNARVIEIANFWLIIKSLAEILVLEPLNTSMYHTGVNLVSISSFKALIDYFFFKYLLLYISKDVCLTAEHKKRITCEGDRLLLHCKYPKVLNIYSAVYGKQLEQENSCPSEEQEPPPFGMFWGLSRFIFKGF